MNNGEQFFESKVMPDLKSALVKVLSYFYDDRNSFQLIDHVLKSDEVRKHKERQKELQVLDKLEQKNIEKEKLKLDMGSDYESSSESSMLEELEFIKNESQESDHEDNNDISELSRVELSKENDQSIV